MKQAFNASSNANLISFARLQEDKIGNTADWDESYVRFTIFHLKFSVLVAFLCLQCIVEVFQIFVIALMA